MAGQDFWFGFVLGAFVTWIITTETGKRFGKATTGIAKKGVEEFIEKLESKAKR